MKTKTKKHVLSLLNPPNMADMLIASRGNLLLPFQFVCNDRTDGKWDIQLMTIANANTRFIVRKNAGPLSDGRRAEPEALWRNCLDRSSKVRSTIRLDMKEYDKRATVPMFRETSIEVRAADTAMGIPPFSMPAALIGAHRYADLEIDRLPGWAPTLEGMLTLLCSNKCGPKPDLWDTKIDLATFINAGDVTIPHGFLPVPGTNAGWAHFHPWMVVFGDEEFLTSPLPTNGGLPSFLRKPAAGEASKVGTPLDAIGRWLSRSDDFLVGDKLDYIRRAQGYEADALQQANA